MSKQKCFGSTACTQKETELDSRASQEQVLARYSKLISIQNKILAKISLSPDDKLIDSIDFMKSECNSFIKSILEELTDLHSSLRRNRRETSEQIGNLQIELNNQKQKYEAIKQEFYQQWQKEHQKQHQVITYLNKQLSQSNEQIEILQQLHYQYKIQKETQINQLNQHNDKLRLELLEMERIIRMERQYGNQKSMELKGMQKLVNEYQSTIQDLQNKIKKRQDYIQSHQEELNLTIQKMNDLDHRIQRKQAQVNILKEKENKLELSLELAKQQITSIKGDNTKMLKNCSQEVLRHQELLQRLKVKEHEKQQQENKIKEKDQQLKDMAERMKLERQNIENKVHKIEQCFKTKNQLLRRLVNGKVRKLKQEHLKMKQMIQKQMLVFIKLVSVECKSSS